MTAMLRHSTTSKASVSAPAIIPADGMNLAIIRQGDDCIELAPQPPIHQWFAAGLTNLPTGRDLTLRLNMAEAATLQGFYAQLWKWVGLRPLFTYADPTAYAAYEWFHRDARGRWRSGALFPTGTDGDAGDDPLPRQTVIPEEAAASFLTPDGASWFPWREIEDTVVQRDAHLLDMRCRFARPDATIAIHTPYTYTYHQAFMQRLSAARLPGVCIDTIGMTKEERALQVIRIEDPADVTPLSIHPGTLHTDHVIPHHITIDTTLPTSSRHKVVLITAREHATEHTGSWVLQGILRALLADTPQAARLRQETTWLLVPIYDPDGSAHSTVNNLTDCFVSRTGEMPGAAVTPGEIIAYAHYFRAFVNSGRPIDIVTSFYCLECNEAEPICCPAAIAPDLAHSLMFNRLWFDRLRETGYIAGSIQPWSLQRMPYRVNGFCNYHYGSLTLYFEVNDRYPTQRLLPAQLLTIGESFAVTLPDFLQTAEGQRRCRETRDFLRDREKNMTLWYRTSIAGTREAPKLFDLLTLGY